MPLARPRRSKPKAPGCSSAQSPAGAAAQWPNSGLGHGDNDAVPRPTSGLGRAGHRPRLRPPADPGAGSLLAERAATAARVRPEVPRRRGRGSKKRIAWGASLPHGVVTNKAAPPSIPEYPRKGVRKRRSYRMFTTALPSTPRSRTRRRASAALSKGTSTPSTGSITPCSRSRPTSDITRTGASG